MEENESKEKKETGNFGKTVLNYIDKGVESSKKGLKTACGAIGDFGDKSVLKIELSQLNGKLDKKYLELGKTAYENLSEGGSITSSDESIAFILQEMKKIKEDISKHEDELKKEKK